MATKTIKAWIDGSVQDVEIEELTSPEQLLSYEDRINTLEDKHEVTFTDGNFLVGNGTAELEEMSPEEVLEHINGSNFLPLSTSEYEALGENDSNANTLYMLIDSDDRPDWSQTDENAIDYIKNKPDINIYKQSGEPTDAPDGSLWVDMDADGEDFINLDDTLTLFGHAADAKAVGDALAAKQPKGEYLTAVPAGYATEIFVTNKIAEAQLAGEEVDLSGYAQKSEIPTKTSELTNDSGYITSIPVESVNSQTGAVILDAAAVGARPDTWMPSASDVGALSVDTVIPTVPTNISAFTNDLGYLTEHQDISGKLDISAFSDTLNDNAVVRYALQDLTAEQQEQARKNLGIDTAESVIIQPSISGFLKESVTNISTSTNYLRTDYVPIAGYNRIEYNVFVVKGTNDMATWVLFDENKTKLASSGDINTEAYYTTNSSGVTLTYGHMHSMISVDDLLAQYPTAMFIVFSTNVTATYESFTNQDGVDVGWGAMEQYAKFIVDDDYGAVRYDKDQELSSEQKLLARQNLGINSVSSNFNNRKYVEEFKTNNNSWDDAFADLIQYCVENNCVACAAGTYTLINPLVIGDIDVDFEHASITNNTTTEACIILTGAEQKVHKFGSIIAREGIGILVNGDSKVYAYNKLHAKYVCGYINALAIVPTNNNCWFNEYHILRMKSSQIPLRVYKPDGSTLMANESYFYLGIIELYRSINPTKLIELTNATRCNFYNLDIEQEIADPVNGAAVELTNCQNIAFFNPRVQEQYNAIQFRFIGKSFYNFVDCEYCKYATIDSSQMQMSDLHFNVIRGSVITRNLGSSTNCNTLRVYKDMIVPTMLAPMVREVNSDIVINPDMILELFMVGNVSMLGIPTLYRWSSGNITINRRFIALLMPKLQIMKIADSVGNILDEDGNVIVSGADLASNKLYNINVISSEYAFATDGEAVSQTYKYLTNIVLSIDPTVNGIKSITIEEV